MSYSPVSIHILLCHHNLYIAVCECGCICVRLQINASVIHF